MKLLLFLLAAALSAQAQKVTIEFDRPPISASTGPSPFAPEN